MTVEALPRIQQQQTYIGPEETTWRNRAFRIVAIVGVVLGAGLLLTACFASISLFVGLAGAVVTALSGYSYHYLSTIDSSGKLYENVKEGNRCWSKFLLFLGANPNIIKNIDTPLYYAAGHFDDETVKILLENGADPTIKPSGDDALNWALIMKQEWEENHANFPPTDNPYFLNERVERIAAANRTIELLQTHNQPVEE